VYRDVKWVGDITVPEAEECYMNWLKIQQSLTYIFKNDVESVIGESPDAMLIVTDGQHPKLLQSVMARDVTIETMAILNDILNFFPMWTRKINDDIIWPEWKRKIEKYIPFIIYDKSKFKNIIKEAVNEYA
jgi:hypothetical protein